LAQKLLTKQFRKWVQKFTGVSVEEQRFDKWTEKNLETGGVNAANCVLVPTEVKYDLYKMVPFDEDGKLLTKFMLTRRQKSRFWDPNRSQNEHQRGEGIGICLLPVRPERKHKFGRCARKSEAMKVHFR
jgi:hypothetical protein